jgi:hypothetical protein
MRRPLTTAPALALSALFVVTPAAAHVDGSDEATDSCPAPEVIDDYDASQFAVAVTLAATGCPQREQRQFPLWVSVTRYDDTSAHGVTSGVLCGPFQAASDIEPGRRYSCEGGVALDHPPVEAAHYEVEVTYPGGGGEERLAFESFCVSDEAGAGCEPQDDSE